MVSLARVANGRLEQSLERQATKPCRHRHPTRNDPGDRDAVPAHLGHKVQSGKFLHVEGHRRASTGVEGVDLGAVPYDRKGVGAQPRTYRLEHGQRDGGGKRGIDGVTATLEYADANL